MDDVGVFKAELNTSLNGIVFNIVIAREGEEGNDCLIIYQSLFRKRRL